MYYVNAGPHIGSAYTTVAADVDQAPRRMQGYDVTLVSRHR